MLLVVVVVICLSVCTPLMFCLSLLAVDWISMKLRSARAPRGCARSCVRAFPMIIRICLSPRHHPLFVFTTQMSSWSAAEWLWLISLLLHCRVTVVIGVSDTRHYIITHRVHCVHARLFAWEVGGVTVTDGVYKTSKVLHSDGFSLVWKKLLGIWMSQRQLLVLFFCALTHWFAQTFVFCFYFLQPSRGHVSPVLETLKSVQMTAFHSPKSLPHNPLRSARGISWCSFEFQNNKKENIARSFKIKFINM